jgi:CysZ protein
VIAQRVIAAEIAVDQSNILTESGLLSGAWNSLVRELQLIGYFLPRTVAVGIVAMMMSFIPVVNLLAPIIAGSWAAWCLCLQYLDYAADSQGVTFLALRKKVSDNRLNSMGFGLTALLASAIPLVNLVMLPASVVAGSLLWCRQHRDLD